MSRIVEPFESESPEQAFAAIESGDGVFCKERARFQGPYVFYSSEPAGSLSRFHGDPSGNSHRERFRNVAQITGV